MRVSGSRKTSGPAEPPERRLDDVFQAAARALRPGGSLVFSVERLVDEKSGLPIRLNPTGRYCHAESYLREALSRGGFAVRSFAAPVSKRPDDLS